MHEIGTAPNFERCSRRWTATGFENEDRLEFSLQGIDAVGNTAPMLSHRWTVGERAIMVVSTYILLILFYSRHCFS